MTQQFMAPGYDPSQAYGAPAGYPQQPQAPAYGAPQGYPQPPAPGYPQQYGAPAGYPQAPQVPGYGAPQGQPQQGAELAAGSLDAFYSQPSVGQGASLKIEAGQTVVGQVARALTDADVQQQTNPQNGAPSFFKDGRPKMIMKVPMLVTPDQTHTDGRAVWYCGPAARDELARAMAAVGAPAGPPEAGATISITCTGTRPSGPGMNPAKTWAVQYQRPEGAGQAQQSAPQQPQAPVAQPEQPQAQQYAAPQQFGQQPQGQQFPQGVPQPQGQQFGQAPVAPQVPQGGAPEGMSPEQAELLARLTGQQQPQG